MVVEVLQIKINLSFQIQYLEKLKDIPSILNTAVCKLKEVIESELETPNSTNNIYYDLSPFLNCKLCPQSQICHDLFYPAR